MIPSYKNLPLGIRLIVMFAVLAINYLLFPSVAALMVLPFYGMDKLNTIFSGGFVTGADKYIFLFVQGVGSIGMFGFTALLLSQRETGFVMKRLGLNARPALKFVAVAVVSVLAAQVFIQFLVELNQRIPVPDGLKFLAEQGKKSEEVINALLKGGTFFQFLANILVLALVPAVGEELFFRGLVLGDLLKSKINPVAAIISTGFLFSMAHAEYNNILAIWVLGSFLGYLYYVSGSLRLSIAAHFTNNFILVLLKYLYTGGFISSDIAEADMPVYAIVVSVVIFAGCLFLLNKWRRPIDFEVELNAFDSANEENELLQNEP